MNWVKPDGSVKLCVDEAPGNSVRCDPDVLAGEGKLELVPSWQMPSSRNSLQQVPKRGVPLLLIAH